MSVHTLVPTIWTLPEPTIFTVLDGIDEIFTYFIRRRLRVTMLGHDHLSKFLLVPVVHVLFLGPLFFAISGVLIEVLLLGLAFNG